MHLHLTSQYTLRDRKEVEVQTGVCQQTAMQTACYGQQQQQQKKPTKKPSALTSGSSAT